VPKDSGSFQKRFTDWIGGECNAACDIRRRSTGAFGFVGFGGRTLAVASQLALLHAPSRNQAGDDARANRPPKLLVQGPNRVLHGLALLGRES
jgi:hypothetical protein